MRPLRIIHKPPFTEEAPVDIDADRMVGVMQESNRIKSDDAVTLCGVREAGEFINGAIWLNSQYDWRLGIDSTGTPCAVPLEKP